MVGEAIIDPLLVGAGKIEVSIVVQSTLAIATEMQNARCFVGILPCRSDVLRADHALVHGGVGKRNSPLLALRGVGNQACEKNEHSHDTAPGRWKRKLCCFPLVVKRDPVEKIALKAVLQTRSSFW
jgi:hypothetical protein